MVGCLLLASLACQQPLGTALRGWRRPAPRPPLTVPDGPVPVARAEPVAVPEQTAAAAPPDTAVADTVIAPETLLCLVDQSASGALRDRSCVASTDTGSAWQQRSMGIDSLLLTVAVTNDRIADEMQDIRREMQDIKCWAKIAANVPGYTIASCSR